MYMQTTRSRAAVFSAVVAALLATIIAPARVRAADMPDFPKSYSAYMKMKPMDAMHMMDKDHKGYVTKDEFMKFHEAMFDNMDRNKDGKLSREEWMGRGAREK